MVMVVQLHKEGSEPIEDDYTDETTSTEEHEPRICYIATVRILGES